MRQIPYAMFLAGTLSFGLGCSGDESAPVKGTPRPAPRVAQQVEEPVVELAAYRYDPSDKPDPFRSYIKQASAMSTDSVASPLERFDLSQLEITGIVWDSKLPRALIKDPTGKGYIVNEGTPVGKNKGRIVRIEDNRIVVKETYVDFQDRATSKEVELKLYGKNGG